MRLLIASIGTRGDAQPYVAAGCALQRRGHEVTLATHEDHRTLAESHGLGFVPVGGSIRSLLESPAGVRWLESSDRPWEYLRAFEALFGAVAETWLMDFDRVLGLGWDGVLLHSFALPAHWANERHRLPSVVLSPFPYLPSAEGMTIGLPRVPGVSSWLERRLQAAFLDRAWRTGRAHVNRWRARHALSLDAIPWRASVSSGAPQLHLFSEHVMSRPRDWPASAHILGYASLDAPDYVPPDDLQAFLDAGPPPVYVGFGSMTGMAPEHLAEIARDAIRRARCRAIVGMGWGGLRALRGADELFVVADVPHDWLFPRVSLVVHHGGAGTTAAALRAGKPSVVVPFFADQPFWAHRVAALGAAPSPVLKRRLTAESLASAIVTALRDPRFAAGAEAVARKLSREDGAERTAEWVEQSFGGR